MDLHVRVGHHGAAEPAGLGAALVLGHQPAGGQHVRDSCASGVSAGARCSTRMEPRPAVRGGEPLGEHPRRARVVAPSGHGQKTPFSGVDPLVGDARRSRRCRRRWPAAARRRPPAGRRRSTGRGRVCRPARPASAGRPARRPAAAAPACGGSPGPRGWSSCRPPPPTARWAAPRRRAPRSRTGRCRRPPAGPAPPSRSRTRLASGRGDHDVGGQHQQRPHPAVGAEPVEHLERRPARQREARPGRCPRPPRRARGPPGRPAAGSPGSWSAFCPCSRPPWPLPWPVIVP